MLINLLIIAVVFAVLFAIFLSKSVYLVKQAESIVIERFGKYNRILGPGIHLIVPFMESPRAIS